MGVVHRLKTLRCQLERVAVEGDAGSVSNNDDGDGRRGKATYNSVLGTFEVGIRDEFTDGVEDLLELFIRSTHTLSTAREEKERSKSQRRWSLTKA